MTLPKEFESIIKEDSGNYGWELANCFSFIANFLGYQVLDISSYQTALKIVANIHGDSLTKYAYPNNLTSYLKEVYPQVHKVLIRKARSIKLLDEEQESDRQQKIADDLAKYMLNQGIELLISLTVLPFYKSFVTNTIAFEIHDCFLDIEEAINNQTTED